MGSTIFQSGPALLHNDLHPKNIIVENGALSGVIDWECSQWGEPDFDLCHLLHWCLLPREPDLTFAPTLGAIFGSSIACVEVPDLWDRLTIYQIEHEIIQLVWTSGASEPERIPRLRKWVDGELRVFSKELVT